MRKRIGAAAALLAGCAAPAAPPGEVREATAFTVEVRMENGAGETVTAPRLLAFGGQRMNVQVLRQESYIQSFEIENGVANPVVATLHAGVLLDGRVVPGGGGDASAFEYRLQIVDPERPFREYRYEAAPKSEVTIQIPTVHRVEVEGTAWFPDGEERLLASLPDPAGTGSFRIRARIVPARLTAEELDGLVLSTSVPVTPPATRSSGWYRVRSGTVEGEWKQGDVVEGAALDSLLAKGAVKVTGDLQWSAAPEAPARASLLEERAYVRDFEPVEGDDSAIGGPIVDKLATGLLADAGALGEVSCTLSSLVRPVQTFTTSLGRPERPVTIELPEIHILRARAAAAGGLRLLVLGTRNGGGSDAVLLSFRPGATGPEE